MRPEPSWLPVSKRAAAKFAVSMLQHRMCGCDGADWKGEMTTINGACHCGNIDFELVTETPQEDIVARACDCSFCRMHVTKNWSDPNGTARLRVRDETKLHRYRFGLEAIDFYICAVCGGYAGAVLDDDDGTWATLNLRLTGLIEVPEVPASYGAQSGEEKRSRRKRVWTPTIVEGVS